MAPIENRKSGCLLQRKQSPKQNGSKKEDWKSFGRGNISLKLSSRLGDAEIAEQVYIPVSADDGTVNIGL